MLFRFSFNFSWVTMSNISSSSAACFSANEQVYGAKAHPLLLAVITLKGLGLALFFANLV